MKRVTLIAMMLISALIFKVHAQEVTTDEKITELNDQIFGLTERLTTAENDLFKLTKIKVSGYIQAQYQKTFSLATEPMNNYFSVRRARVKFTYEASDGIKFVVQPDFAPQALSIKDAYVVLNDRWTKSFSLTAGKFNRPNYEVEYSSSQRELPERSSVIRALYPGERAIGAKLEFNPQSFPLHLQLAVFNGADGLTIADAAKVNLNNNENKDFDNGKDVMVRATYNLSLGSFGGLDFGAHAYIGSLKSLADTTLSSDFKEVTKVKIGDAVKRNWIGGEFQLFADILGGMSLKGEYIAGKNATIGYKNVKAVAQAPDKLEAKAVSGLPNFQNNFAGYYLYLIKNLGKKNQFAFRYDYYDPNTDVNGKDLSSAAMIAGFKNKTYEKKISASDLAATTYGFALHHYFDDNLRISLAYDIVQNEKVGSAGVITGDYARLDGTNTKDDKNQDGTKKPGLDYNNTINNNMLTLRIQAKF